MSIRIRSSTECFYSYRNPVEDEVVLPALVNLVEPVLDVVVGHDQTLHLGSRLLAPCSLLGRLLAAGQGAPGHSRDEAEAASSSSAWGSNAICAVYNHYKKV